MSEDAVEYDVCGTRRHGGGGGLTRREQIATAIAAAAVRNDTMLRRLDGDLTKTGQHSTGVGEWAAEQADLLLERLYRPRKAEGGAR